MLDLSEHDSHKAARDEEIDRACADKCAQCGISRSGQLPAEIRQHVDGIRVSAKAGYLGTPAAAQRDVGYLLEVVDALDSGRL